VRRLEKARKQEYNSGKREAMVVQAWDENRKAKFEKRAGNFEGKAKP
jgi:hypothetical protein